MSGDIYFCSASNGFGAFLKSYAGIFILSLLTKRQINFHCPYDHGAKNMNQIMHTFFDVKYKKGSCNHKIRITHES